MEPILFRGEGGGVITLFFLLNISSSWVNLRLHTENQLYTLPGSTLKVCVWWWWVLKVNLVISFGFSQAEQ